MATKVSAPEQPGVVGAPRKRGGRPYVPSAARPSTLITRGRPSAVNLVLAAIDELGGLGILKERSATSAARALGLRPPIPHRETHCSSSLDVEDRFPAYCAILRAALPRDQWQHAATIDPQVAPGLPAVGTRSRRRNEENNNATLFRPTQHVWRKGANRAARKGFTVRSRHGAFRHGAAI